MLDTLRRHASSWIVKTILGLIIASFALFFGYSQLRSQIIDAQQSVAKVGSIPIGRQKFEILLDQNLESIRQSNPTLPPEIENFLKQTLLQQLIDQEVTTLYAEEIGIQISDQAIAEKIRNIFSNQGAFDFGAYQQQRQSTLNRTGEDIEDLIRKELAQQELRRIAQLCFLPWDEQTPFLSPDLLLSKWIEQFRETVTIELYPGNS